MTAVMEDVGWPPGTAELAAQIRRMNRAQFDVMVAGLNDVELELVEAAIAYARDSYFPSAREKQKPPEGDWAIWLILSGRGFGKTRTGSEWIIEQGTQEIGKYAVVAENFGKGRDICFEGRGDDGGAAGILSVLERRGRHDEARTWNSSLGQLHLRNGSVLQLISAERPDAPRGLNLSGALCDELAAWRYPATFDQLRLAVRIGRRPQIVIATTPKPTPLIKHLVADEDHLGVVVTRGSTWENRRNLSPFALAELERKYSGTRLGRQELEGELLDDVEGALWQREWIDAARVVEMPEGLVKIVVAVDPAVTATDDSDETGIIAAGRTKPRYCPVCGPVTAAHAFVLADRTCTLTPAGWAKRAVALYEELGADRMVAEVNQGGDMVEGTIRNVSPGISYAAVRAKSGKALRAQPVAAVYEQGRVHHVGTLPELEDQCCSWSPLDGQDSPDRLDALVYAIVELGMTFAGPTRTSAPEKREPLLPKVPITRTGKAAGKVVRGAAQRGMFPKAPITR